MRQRLTTASGTPQQAEAEAIGGQARTSWAAAMPSPSSSGFQVLGVGLPRTGTLSLSMALSRLLDGQCYHCSTLYVSPDHEMDFWERAIDANGAVPKQHWVDFFQGRGFKAAVDCPTILFYRELLAAYPDCKVVLTVRDPDAWYSSVRNSIFGVRDVLDSAVASAFLAAIGHRRVFHICKMFLQYTNGSVDRGLLDAISDGRDSAVSYYRQWESVARSAMADHPDRFLVFDVKQGWSPLCRFLGVPEPSVAFPRSNDAVITRAIVRLVMVTSHAYLAGLVAAVSLCWSAPDFSPAKLVSVLLACASILVFYRVALSDGALRLAAERMRCGYIWDSARDRNSLVEGSAMSRPLQRPRSGSRVMMKMKAATLNQDATTKTACETIMGI